MWMKSSQSSLELEPRPTKPVSEPHEILRAEGTFRCARTINEVMSILQLAMMGKLPHTTLRDAVFVQPTLGESFNNLFTRFDS